MHAKGVNGMHAAREVVVAAVQQDVVLRDQEATTRKVCSWIDRAAEKDVDIVVFPELILSSGYALGDEFYERAETPDGPHVRAVAQKAREQRIYVVVGFAESSPEGAVYNSAALLGRDGSIVGVYRKTHMFTPTESFFRLGSVLRTFDVDFGRVAIPICYDLEFPETGRLLCLQGAEMLLSPTAHWIGPHTMETPEEHFARTVYSARALENRVPVVMANRVGHDPHLGARFMGLSRILDANGLTLAAMPDDSEGLITSRINLDAEWGKRRGYNYFRDRRPLLYGPLADAR
jgi:predicted amidohydrolase